MSYSTIIYPCHDAGLKSHFTFMKGTVISSRMNNWWQGQSKRFSCKFHHYFILGIDMELVPFCNIVPAVGMLVCASVCPFPSAPAGSAGVGALLSACSSHPAGHTETQPGCGHPPASLHHRWALLKHTAEQNLSYNIYCIYTVHPQRDICWTSSVVSMLQCLCVIFMNIKQALESSFTHQHASKLTMVMLCFYSQVPHTYTELLYFMCNAKIQPQPTETLTVCSIREVCITSDS